LVVELINYGLRTIKVYPHARYVSDVYLFSVSSPKSEMMDDIGYVMIAYHLKRHQQALDARLAPI
jgi:hypothetical protein